LDFPILWVCRRQLFAAVAIAVSTEYQTLCYEYIPEWLVPYLHQAAARKEGAVAIGHIEDQVLFTVDKKVADLA